MGNMNEAHLEWEHELHESELEGMGESGEGEGILGTIGSALGGLFGEEELEHNEFGESHESGEGELHELHELHEFEGLHESGESHELQEFEGFGEYESGEQFFGGLKRLVKRAAPFLKKFVKFAAPMVGTAIGGPFGGMLGKVASSALGEEEGEWEQHEGEFELEDEYEQHEYEHGEAAHEVAHEIAQHETAVHEAYAEMLAEAAMHEQNEAHAEAMIGAAVVSVLSPADRRALRSVMASLVRGSAVLAALLRRRRGTRPFVRTIPTIMRRTVRSLKKHAAAGRPITRRLAARTAASQVRRVLGNPSACAAALSKSVIARRRLATPRRPAYR